MKNLSQNLEVNTKPGLRRSLQEEETLLNSFRNKMWHSRRFICQVMSTTGKSRSSYVQQIQNKR